MTLGHVSNATAGWGKQPGAGRSTIIVAVVFERSSEVAAQRLNDRELIEQLVAIENFSDTDKQVVKAILSAMIVKQRVEAAVR